MQHIDDTRDTMRRELRDSSAALNDTIEAKDQQAHQAMIQAAKEVRRHTDESCAAICANVEELAAATEKEHAQLRVNMDKTKSSARQAQDSANKAWERVDKYLSEAVHKASQALVARIDEAAKNATQNSERKDKEIESGLYGLVAREALDVELRAAVERATRQLQLVSDDIAQRSHTMQEHGRYAERRLIVCSDTSTRKANVEPFGLQRPP